MKKQTIKLFAVSGMLVAMCTQVNAQIWSRNSGAQKTYLTNINDKVGIGTTNPSFTIDVQTATGNAALNMKSLNGTANVIIDRANSTLTAGVMYRTNGSPLWQTGTIGTNEFLIRNAQTAIAAVTIDNTTNNIALGPVLPNANTLTVGGNADISGKLGIGIASPYANKLDVAGASSSEPVVNISNATTGINVDVRGLQVSSVTNPGYGIGLQSTGGYMGLYGYANATTYTGGAFGVYGYAGGSASSGTRYGIYGYAYGGSENWGGYFPTKTYTSELRVGGTQGASGYVACINGKLIATEVRVELQSSWPDYVFSKEHNLMSIDELEEHIYNNNHLPGIPPAYEIESNGIMLGEMQTKTMEKVEELTLYIIQLNKENKELKARLEKLENK